MLHALALCFVEYKHTELTIWGPERLVSDNKVNSYRCCSFVKQHSTAQHLKCIPSPSQYSNIWSKNLHTSTSNDRLETYSNRHLSSQQSCFSILSIILSLFSPSVDPTAFNSAPASNCQSFFWGGLPGVSWHLSVQRPEEGELMVLMGRLLGVYWGKGISVNAWLSTHRRIFLVTTHTHHSFI